MRTLELDPRFTFEAFIVGEGNRLACAAARRVAESPGSTYNPLFIYSASGLGKTHLVTAIGQYARRVLPELRIVYDTLEHFMEAVMAAIEEGERESFREQLGEIGLLLLDDVQFLAGRHRTQEELLRAWDTITSRGGQVVLTSDRPPHEIDGLDERLLSRFAGGLIVDVGPPDYETRVAIVRRKAEERGQTLADGVAEALARFAFANVRELQGALNRILAVQELEGREIGAEEAERILRSPVRTTGGEFHDFVAEISETVGEMLAHDTAERQLADAILRWEGEGYRTRRLEAALAEPGSDEAIEQLVRGFEADVARLREIVSEIAALDPGAPELDRLELLRDPDRVEEAEVLLEGVRDRMRPLPAPPGTFTFASLPLEPDLFAVRVAAAAAEEPGSRYNPIYIHGPENSGKSALLAALGRALMDVDPERSVGYLDGATFARELIQAIEKNRVDGWRIRFRRTDALLIDDVDVLADTERAQAELFHLFDDLIRAGAQLAFTASCPPQELTGLEDRLRTRLGSGVVVELEGPVRTETPARDAEEPPLQMEGPDLPAEEPALAAEESALPTEEPAWHDGAAAFDPEAGAGTEAATGARGGTVDAVGVAAEGGERDGSVRGPDRWFEDREKLPIRWPYPVDRLSEELE